MNSELVGIGKPKVGGAVYRGEALSASLPTSASSTIDTTAFTELGYCSEDGIVNGSSRTSTDIKAWGGDIIASPLTEKKDTWKMTLVEATNVEVLKLVKGADNVTGTLSTGIVVKENSEDLEHWSFIIDMVLSADVVKRVTIPNGKISEISDVTYKDDTAVGYEITITAYPDSNGNTHYEYILES